MTYQKVWSHPNYVEYGTGLNSPKTWPNVQEQYRRPDALYDLRYYDLPTENYGAKLYYNMPRLGQPKYRATFRDKPFTHAAHYPGEDPQGKPSGFYGRVYYENGPPQFKYDGPPKDDLYWLERPPYLPSFPKSRSSRSFQGNELDSMRGLNTAPAASPCRTAMSSPLKTAGSARSADLAPVTTVPAPGASPVSRASAARPQSQSNDPLPNAFMSTYKSTFTNPTKRITMDGVGYL